MVGLDIWSYTDLVIHDIACGLGLYMMLHADWALHDIACDLGAYTCRVRTQLHACRVQAQSLHMSCASSNPTYVVCELGAYVCCV